MERFFIGVSLTMCVFMLLCMYRAVMGPTVYDRVIGGGFVGTNASAVLLLIGFIYNRIDMFVDLALAYSILNFIGTIIVSKYFLRRGVR